MLGRLLKSEDYKGHREMIDAWPAVRLQVPDAELWVAGDGNLRSELQNFVKELGMSSCIRFLGSVSEEEKLKLLQQARCLTLPSRGEGFGLVYLEAMRIGRPCLVSILDAGREVVGPPEAGMEVDPRDANALTEAVCQLLTPDESWRQVSLAAQARYESRFTAEHFQSRLSTALEPWLARS
jgi:phosphatidylinositol alpha-1,6-mannosyltransferase